MGELLWVLDGVPWVRDILGQGCPVGGDALDGGGPG
jgi:hypothetical protein